MKWTIGVTNEHHEFYTAEWDGTEAEIRAKLADGVRSIQRALPGALIEGTATLLNGLVTLTAGAGRTFDARTPGAFKVGRDLWAVFVSRTPPGRGN